MLTDLPPFETTAPGTVVIASLALPVSLGAALCGGWYATLDPAEQARADRFRFAADREAYIAAHRLTRVLLARFGDRAAPDWRFVTGRFGKPAIDPVQNHGGWQFSLSHTKGLVACALGRDAELGLDVEARDRIVDALELAAHNFAPAEVAWLRALPAAQRQRDFLRLWTLKEATVKATGQGLSASLADFAFTLDPIRIAFTGEDADDPARWQFHQQTPTDRHLLALAVRRTVPGPRPVPVVGVALTTADL